MATLNGIKTSFASIERICYVEECELISNVAPLGKVSVGKWSEWVSTCLVQEIILIAPPKLQSFLRLNAKFRRFGHTYL